MKKIFVLIFPILSVFSCMKGNHFPSVETITKGSKWGITIGSSPEDVYSQLQALGKQKDFSQVSMVYRKPYSSPQEIQHLLGFYHSITLMSNAAVIERVLIQFTEDKVSSISAGGALPKEVSQWPAGVPDEAAIHKNDPVDAIYSKLLAIYQMSAYSNYQIILPDKPLEKPFDPDMVKYGEWAFSFSVDIRSGVVGTSSVRLYFKDGRLDKIWHQYNEGNVVIN